MYRRAVIVVVLVLLALGLTLEGQAPPQLAPTDRQQGQLLQLQIRNAQLQYALFLERHKRAGWVLDEQTLTYSKAPAAE